MYFILASMIYIIHNDKIKFQPSTCSMLPAWYQPFIPLTVLLLGMNMHNYMQVLSTLVSCPDPTLSQGKGSGDH